MFQIWIPHYTSLTIKRKYLYMFVFYNSFQITYNHKLHNYKYITETLGLSLTLSFYVTSAVLRYIYTYTKILI